MSKNDYPPTYTIDLPADEGVGKAIVDEVYGHSSKGTRTNFGMPDDDLSVTRALESAVREAIAAAFFPGASSFKDDAEPSVMARFDTIRKVEYKHDTGYDGDRVVVTIQKAG